jgi:hypothetical protein
VRSRYLPVQFEARGNWLLGCCQSCPHKISPYTRDNCFIVDIHYDIVFSIILSLALHDKLGHSAEVLIRPSPLDLEANILAPFIMLIRVRCSVSI